MSLMTPSSSMYRRAGVSHSRHRPFTPNTNKKTKTISSPPCNGVDVPLLILIQTTSRLHTPSQGGEEEEK